MMKVSATEINLMLNWLYGIIVMQGTETQEKVLHDLLQYTTHKIDQKEDIQPLVDIYMRDFNEYCNNNKRNFPHWKLGDMIKVIYFLDKK